MNRNSIESVEGRCLCWQHCPLVPDVFCVNGQVKGSVTDAARHDSVVTQPLFYHACLLCHFKRPNTCSGPGKVNPITPTMVADMESLPQLLLDIPNALMPLFSKRAQSNDSLF